MLCNCICNDWSNFDVEFKRTLDLRLKIASNRLLSALQDSYQSYLSYSLAAHIASLATGPFCKGVFTIRT